MASTALVTGASSGIGYALAEILAADGYHLVLVARNVAKLAEMKQGLEARHKIQVQILPKDLSEPAASQELFDQLQSEGVVVEVLVNNAGFGDYGPFAEARWDKTDEMIRLNILSLTHLTHLLVTGMVQRGHGRILNLASTAAFQPGPLMAVYYASKAYVLHFSEALANELQGTGVTVTALCPGPTATGFQQAADLQDSKLVKGKRLPSAEEVARFGYRAMLQGKPVAIPGLMNWLLALSIRFTPRAWVTKIVRGMQETTRSSRSSRA